MKYQVTKGKNYWEVEIKFMRIFLLLQILQKQYFQSVSQRKGRLGEFNGFLLFEEGMGIREAQGYLSI